GRRHVHRQSRVRAAGAGLVLALVLGGLLRAHAAQGPAARALSPLLSAGEAEAGESALGLEQEQAQNVPHQRMAVPRRAPAHLPRPGRAAVGGDAWAAAGPRTAPVPRPAPA